MSLKTSHNSALSRVTVLYWPIRLQCSQLHHLVPDVCARYPNRGGTKHGDSTERLHWYHPQLFTVETGRKRTELNWTSTCFAASCLVLERKHWLAVDNVHINFSRANTKNSRKYQTFLFVITSRWEEEWLKTAPTEFYDHHTPYDRDQKSV